MKNLFQKLLTISHKLWAFQKHSKTIGVTLIELLIAIGISSIVMVSVLTTIGGIYFSQKKIRFSQNFYTESRILMERLAQLARNNTIDYDRYFLEVGPDPANCTSFKAGQNSTATPIAHSGNASVNKTKRASLGGYSSIFYWDTDADNTQDRNLGGVTPEGQDSDNDGSVDPDPCTQAFHGTSQETLYLINGARTLRTAIRNKDEWNTVTDPTNDADEDYRVEIQRQLGADIDNDLVADIWGPYDNDGDGTVEYADGDIQVVWDNTGSNGCRLQTEANEYYPILGDKTSEDFCMKAHAWTSISPKLMKIDDLTFHPAPDRDPFLNFRVDSAQIHPHVFINLKTNVRDPDAHGFEAGKQPKLSFQTMVSSRVFGNTR